MVRYYRFGQFQLRVCGSQSHINLLPCWNQDDTEWNTKPFPGITLRLEESAPIASLQLNDGWSAEFANGMWQAAYSTDHKSLFALRYRSDIKDVTILLPDREETVIRQGLQFGMLTALYRESVGLHGVTLLCGDEIIILSAPSGTGKTTLAHLLETYCDAIVINGDFAMLSINSKGVIFEPTPFCGTSGRCLNHRVRVNRIVFLEQAKDNHWQNLTGTSALVKLMSNAYIPFWDSALHNTIQKNILEFLPHVKINHFAFAPTEKAAKVFFDMINSGQ